MREELEEMKKTADRLFEEALEASGAKDPRKFYREALRELKGTDDAGYRKAATHYEEVLVPAIASEGADPLLAWREYGRHIAEVTARGRTVAIDDAGKAEAYSTRTPLGHLVLHLPDDRKRRAILVSLPAELSPAQRASYELLVKGKQRLPDGFYS